MYTTTEARESHCNFRGTKQETSKLLQVAHLPSCLGFIPGVSTGVGSGTCGEREDREEERDGGEQHKGSTPKQKKQEHEEDELLLPAGLVLSF